MKVDIQTYDFNKDYEKGTVVFYCGELFKAKRYVRKGNPPFSIIKGKIDAEVGKARFIYDDKNNKPQELLLNGEPIPDTSVNHWNCNHPITSEDINNLTDTDDIEVTYDKTAINEFNEVWLLI